MFQLTQSWKKRTACDNTCHRPCVSFYCSFIICPWSSSLATSNHCLLRLRISGIPREDWLEDYPWVFMLDAAVSEWRTWQGTTTLMGIRLGIRFFGQYIVQQNVLSLQAFYMLWSHDHIKRNGKDGRIQLGELKILVPGINRVFKFWNAILAV